MSAELVTLVFHFHQPSREASHSRLKHVNTDPQRINWTEVITQQSYKYLSKHVLQKVSYDISGTLDLALETIDPETASAMRTHFLTNGIAHPSIHALIPDLPKVDKRIGIGAGVNRFIKLTGRKPKYFWPPETAIDTETAEVLADFDIWGFFCAPGQIELKEGGNADNIPTLMKLPSGRVITALPFDRVFSKKLAFDDEERARDDAYKFTDLVVLPGLQRLRNGFPLLGCTDGETFGHHMKWGGAFIDTLVNHALPERGINVVSINEVDMKKVTFAEGRIRERTAWSCPHENLARWRGECDCGSEGLDVSWKRPFYGALHRLNNGVTEILKKELGDNFPEKVIDRFDQALRNPGPPFTTPELSLISTKTSSLNGVSSDGTFSKDPGATGNNNILFARQAVEHLKDAGLKEEAARIWTQFLNTMREVHNPAYHNRSGVEMAHDLLGEIADDGYLAAAA